MPADRTRPVGGGMPLPALHRRNQRAVDKTRMAPRFVIARRPQADVAP